MGNWKRSVKRLLKRYALTRYLLHKRDQILWRQQVTGYTRKRYPDGHFYSPIPDLKEVQRHREEIFSVPEEVPGVDLRREEQLALLRDFAEYGKDIPFKSDPAPGLRFYFENGSYQYPDAFVLHCMIRHLKPERIIEVGSGFSSALTLDTNELFFDHSISCTFIEPYPKLLKSLLEPENEKNVNILPQKLQDVQLGVFDSLKENDILFIDSTHMSKVGSDVNYLIFDVLPRLKKGVCVHFHDIFYPFEYPEEWIMEGVAWNECYILRAFLQYNDAFRIEFFTDYLLQFPEAEVKSVMPGACKGSGGSLWLRRTGRYLPTGCSQTPGMAGQHNADIGQ